MRHHTDKYMYMSVHGKISAAEMTSLLLFWLTRDINIYIYKVKRTTLFMSLYPERETNVESVSERGTVDISRNSLNPFHVSFHVTLKQFLAKLTLLPRKTHAKSTLIPRKIHGKKSRDMRDSTFVSVRDINITLTVLYLQSICPFPARSAFQLTF